MKVAVLLLMMLLQKDAFTKMTYCVVRAVGPYEKQCVSLSPTGRGEANLKRRGGDMINVPIVLADRPRDRFLAAVAGVDYMSDTGSWESKNKVANLGLKTITLEGAGPTPRIKEYNYSPQSEVRELGNFFDNVINQETIVLDVEMAMQYDKLAIPKWIDRIEGEVKGNRIADPERLIPLIAKIENDTKFMNYARANAKKLRESILARKP